MVECRSQLAIKASLDPLIQHLDELFHPLGGQKATLLSSKLWD
jgi:hypothetical protein